MRDTQYAALDSTLLLANKKVSCTLECGRTKYFHIDVPTHHHPAGAKPSLSLRLTREGGAPTDSNVRACHGGRR